MPQQKWQEEHSRRTTFRRTLIAQAVGLSVMAGLATPVLADNLPAMGESADPWKVDVFYENDTRYRGKDATGQTVGLSKFRNTLQIEADKGLSDGWAFHGVFRGTWDGVYRLNKDEFGRNAGSKQASDVQLSNTAGPFGPPLGAPYTNPTVPFGGGVGNSVVAAIQSQGAAGLGNMSLVPTFQGINKFVDTYTNANANGTGLRVLGDRWHGPDSGVAFAVPVRPCDSDSRGCRDFGGYGNKKLNELEMPEFNSRLDFIREFYVKKTAPLSDGTDLFLKIGRQQVVWGRTDLFRVLDVINPVDFSRNNIYDELQDIRIPMWIAQAEYRFGGSESMQERNLQFVWNFDKFRPNNLGQCGTPNVILDAGCFFRGMANLWDNGGTVANFAGLSTPGTPAPDNGPWYATNFGPNQIGIRNVNLPKWSLSNTQLGMKFEGITQNGLNFSLNALTYRSQLPSLRSINTQAVNPFTGANGNSSPVTTAAAGGAAVPQTTNLIAFDMYYPRVQLLGGSLDFQSEDLGAAFRVEGAFTNGEEFANTARPELYSKNKVFRSVIGVDRPTFIPFISSTRATLISAQLFWQHIFNHELSQGTAGPVGMPDWKDNYIGTVLIKGFLSGDRISPQLIMARDFKAKSYAIAPAVEWSVTNDLKITVGANFKGGKGGNGNQFDDCRSCNPYAPFTTYLGHVASQANPFAPGSIGVGGFEPLGRFRAGPIGTAIREDEIHFTMRYKF